jgi:hypothetical protein
VVVRVGGRPFLVRPWWYYNPWYYPTYFYSPAVPPMIFIPYASAPVTNCSNGTAIPTPYQGTVAPGASDGTHDDNGGPGGPVPQPKVAPAPTPVPAAGLRSVSLPRQPAPRVAYPAYGDQPTTSPAPSGRTYLTKTR